MANTNYKNTHLPWQEGVYVYTTDEKKKDRIKIGMTARHAATCKDAVLERIGEQQTAGNQDEVQELLTYFDCAAAGFKALDIESRFHRQFDAYRIGKKGQGVSEWFWTHDTKGNEILSLNDVTAFWNKLTQGVERPYTFPLRAPQQRFVDTASAYYAAGGKDFLGAMIMRFGKTFSTYELVRKMGWTRILILSAKTDVKKAWKDDLLTHVNYTRYEWIDAVGYSRDNPIELPVKKTTPIVVFLSIQDAKKYTKEKLTNIFATKWDLVVIDETHFGIDTEMGDILFGNLKYERRLDLSGTAFKKLISGEYTAENTFYYGLLEELADINAGIFSFLDLPKLNLLTIDIEQQIKDKILDVYENPDDGFRWSSLFAVDSKTGDFVHPAAVRTFLDTLKPVMPYEGGGISPWHLDQTAQYMDHIIWFVPKRVAIVEALVKMLRSHPFYKDYEILQAAGDNEGDKNDEVLRMIKQYELRGKKTIVVSAGKFSTGVSKPEWYLVLLMTDTEDSPEEYFQSMFRCKTPNKDANKTECFAINLNPDRALIMRYKFAQIQNAIDPTKTVQQHLDQFNRVLPICNIRENTITETSIEEILGAMSRGLEAVKVWTQAYMVNKDALDDSDVIDVLENLDAAEIDEIDIEINKNGVRKGKNKRTVKRKNADDNDDEERKQKVQNLRERALSVTQGMPTYLGILFAETGQQITSVKEFLDTLDEELFEQVTDGVCGEVVRYLFAKGVFNEDLMTRGFEMLYVTLDNLTKECAV